MGQEGQFREGHGNLRHRSPLEFDVSCNEKRGIMRGIMRAAGVTSTLGMAITPRRAISPPASLPPLLCLLVHGFPVTEFSSQVVLEEGDPVVLPEIVDAAGHLAFNIPE